MNPKIYLVGFDGYRENINENNQVLAKENQKLINDLVRIKNIDLYSLTPTRYEGIKVISLFDDMKKVTAFLPSKERKNLKKMSDLLEK